MTERAIQQGTVRCETFDEKQVGPDPLSWLRDQAREGMLVLAHADDGLLWGRVQDGGFVWPPKEVYEQAQWRQITLQMARLFDADQEVLLWRTGENAWRARRLTDGEGAACSTLDEAQVLWGTEVVAAGGGFTCVVEGEQGFRHAMPLVLNEQADLTNHPLRLDVRHYLSDDEGWLRISNSRLTGLRMEGMK